jgi:hypothetical protein
MKLLRSRCTLPSPALAMQDEARRSNISKERYCQYSGFS